MIKWIELKNFQQNVNGQSPRMQHLVAINNNYLFEALVLLKHLKEYGFGKLCPVFQLLWLKIRVLFVLLIALFIVLYHNRLQGLTHSCLFRQT